MPGAVITVVVVVGPTVVVVGPTVVVVGATVVVGALVVVVFPGLRAASAAVGFSNAKPRAIITVVPAKGATTQQERP